jgi:transposase
VTVDLKTQQILATCFCSGKKHDFQLLKENHYAIASTTCVIADAGYQGLTKIHSNTQTPIKKTKLHPLNVEQKAYNHSLSLKRILVENVIRKLKIFRILNQRYRNRRKRFALRFNLMAAIYNLEIQLPL